MTEDRAVQHDLYPSAAAASPPPRLRLVEDADVQTAAAPPPRARRGGWLLGLSLVLLPVMSVWLVLRRGYPMWIRIASSVWLAVIGAALIVSASYAPTPAAGKPAPAPRPPAAPLLTTTVPSPSLDYSLGEAQVAYRRLRTPATIRNTTGADLAYAEIFCSFYDAGGKLLGHGIGNWKTVPAGKSVSGEIIAAGVDLEAVARRDCRARGP